MKVFAVLSALVVAVSCSTLEFRSVPSSIGLPQSGDLKTSQLGKLNAQLLGLSASPVSGFSVQTDLFSRPKALAIVTVEGVDSLPGDKQKYQVETDSVDQSAIEQQLALAFGGAAENVAVGAEGATGSALAAKLAEQKVDDAAVKTKLEPLRQELLQVYRLAAAIRSQGAKLKDSDSPDVYRVRIAGLGQVASQLSDDEMNEAVMDVEKAVEELSSAVSSVYGEQVVLEVLAVSVPIKQSASANQSAAIHNIHKRAADEKYPAWYALLKSQRERLNVGVFTSTDYPAIFAIFAGLSIVLALAIIYIAVGLLTMDPGRDSIIYRMTTTRMKKD